jgi:integrase
MSLNSENLNFHEYYADWIELYKKDLVRPVTYQKYVMTLRRLTELAPGLQICDLDKRNYQILLNNYARTHEKQTTKDFNNHLKSAILDAIDEGYIKADPTRKVIIKGKPPPAKKLKFLSKFEIQSLLQNLELSNGVNWDWAIYIGIMTGMRISEILGITSADIDIERKLINVNKTWNYKKSIGEFQPTKNQSSVRKIQADKIFITQLYRLAKKLNPEKPIFAQGENRIFASTINGRLKSLCKKSGIPIISMHGLRHTHASLLIYEGISIASIAKRLGHSNTTTTQQTYLHIIKELEEKDGKKIVQHLLALRNI